MANIILPAVPVLSEINDNTKLLIEQAGEINRYPISDLDIGGGDVTINLSSSDSVDNIGNPINADTLGGYLAEDYVKHGEIRVTARNLLDNSDFTKPVNQRGKTSYANVGYTIDRWRANDANYKVEIVSGGVKLTNDSQSRRYLEQIIDRPDLIGKILTVVVEHTDDTVMFGTAKVHDNPSISANVAYTFGTNSYVGIVNWNGKPTVWIALGSAEGTTIKNIAVYEGEYTLETLPPYVSKGYGVELAECLRYFYRFPKSVRFFSTKNAGIYGINVFYPTMMRIMPTISWENNVGAISIDHRTNIGFSAYYTGTEEAINDLTVSADL